MVMQEEEVTGLPSGEVFEGGHRWDGRSFEEFRGGFLRTGVISQAVGSAYAEFGSTKIMIGVYGPRQSDRREASSVQRHGHGRLLVTLRLPTLPKDPTVAFYQSQEEKELAAAIQTALESVVDVSTFPKLVLIIQCDVIESGGGEIPIAITAASLAVADAGIEMKDLVTACSVSRVKNTLLLDPSTQERGREEAGVLVAATGVGGEVAQLVTRGVWEDGALKEALELGLGGCAQLDEAARQVLKESVSAA